MKSVVACALWCLAALTPVAAADREMLHIEYQIVAYGVDPGSFPAMPRRLWRAGPGMLRLEEPVDPANGEHRLVISALPDIWYIDLGLRHGVHGRDTSAKPAAHFPVFTVEPGDPLAALEMGAEVAFFAGHGARDAADKPVAGVDCSVQEVQLGDRQLALYRRKTDGMPVLVSVQAGEQVLGVRYLTYQTGVPLDPGLFVPPSDIEMEEAAARQ